jgi:magnesium transporter
VICCALVRAKRAGSALKVLSAEELAQPRIDLARYDLVWVDIAEPAADDVDWLERTFGFHRLALEDVSRRNQRAKIDEYPGYYFAVLYAARPDVDAHRIAESELQFFWSASYLVTIHADPFPEIADIATRARDGMLTASVGADGRTLVVADIAYRLIDAVVDGYFPVADALADWTEDIEEKMFASVRGRTQDTLQAIFDLRKQLLQMRKTIAPSREIVNVLLRRDHALFADEFLPYFQDIYDHTVRIIDTLDTYRDLLASALDVHLSIVSNDVSQTVKKMTAVTAILMVNALIAGVYGMNFDIMPELHWQYGYVWALGLMVAASVGLWIHFRRIRWW